MKNLDIIYMRHNIDTVANTITPSNIRYYELTILFKGELCYYADKTAIPLKSGDAVFLRPGTMRAREHRPEKADYISFNFTCDREIDLPERIEHAVNNDVVLITALYDSISQGPFLDNKEKVEYLLYCLILIMEERTSGSRYSRLTVEIIKYIRANFSKKITLADIGQTTFFSPIYCDTVFKRETGRSIIDYLIEMRITEAKSLLMNASFIPLATVAERVGFGDYNYFSRVFKKRTGYTPGEYRKLTSV